MNKEVWNMRFRELLKVGFMKVKRSHIVLE